MNEIQILEVSQRYTELAREAGIVPRELNPAQIQAIIIAGREMGLPPLQSLRTMSFVNGRLVMAVQLQLALARQRAGVQVAELIETDESCTVTLTRGSERVTCTYTLADATRAGLTQQHNWRRYPRQMLRWRAIGDALRILAPDVVAGLLAPDEAESLTVENALENTEATEAPPESTPPLPEPEPEPNGDGHDHDAQLPLRELRARDRERYNRILRALQARGREVFPSDDARREWLQRNYCVRSYLDLTLAQAREAFRLMGGAA